MKRFIIGRNLARENEPSLIDQAAQVNDQQAVGDPAAPISAVNFDQEIQALKQEQGMPEGDENLLDGSDGLAEPDAGSDGGDGTDGGDGGLGEPDSGSDGTSDGSGDPSPEPEPTEPDEDEDEEEDTPAEDSQLEADQEAEVIEEDKQAAAESLTFHVMAKLSMAAEAIEKANYIGYVSPNVRKLVDGKLRECAKLLGVQETNVMAAENASSASFFVRIKEMIKKLIIRIKEWIKTGYRNLTEMIANNRAYRGHFEKNMEGYVRRLEQIKKFGDNKGHDTWPRVTIKPPVASIRDREGVAGYNEGIVQYMNFVVNVLQTFAQVPGKMGEVAKNLDAMGANTTGSMLAGLSTNCFEDIVKPTASSSLLTRNVRDIKVRHAQIKGNAMFAFDVIGLLGHVNFEWTYAREASNSGDIEPVIEGLSRTSFTVTKDKEPGEEEIDASPEVGLAIASIRNQLLLGVDGAAEQIKMITSAHNVFIAGLDHIEKTIEQSYSSTDEGYRTDQVTKALRLVSVLIASFEASYLHPLRAIVKINTAIMRSTETAVVAIVSANEKVGT